MKTTLGIDLGTQSIKVLFYNSESKRIEAQASEKIGLFQDENGAAEQDAQWWIDALVTALSRIPKNIKNSAVALSVSGQQHGFVALDKNRNVLHEVKLWCDTSTTAEVDEIHKKVGGEKACIEAIGNAMVSGYTAPKVLWLKNNEPQKYADLDCILLPHDYLNFYLTGELTMEYGDASGTGFFDIKNRCWSKSLLSAIDSDRNLTNHLPELKEAHECAGYLKSDIAKLLGLPEGIPAAMGGGDNMMGAIGTGNVSPGCVTISLGSSGTVYAYSDQPVIDKDGRLAAFCSSTGGWLPLLCTMNCTLSTELQRKLFDLSIEELEAAVASSPIGSEGVLTLAFFNGERTPNLPNAKASILGLDSHNFSQANLVRSTMESASFALRFGIDALKDNKVNLESIRVTGGGSKSARWRQMIADICDCPVVQPTPDEGAAFGAALQAFVIYQSEQGIDSDITSIVNEHVCIPEHNTTYPISENVTAYQAVYEQYLRAVDTISHYYQ